MLNNKYTEKLADLLLDEAEAGVVMCCNENAPTMYAVKGNVPQLLAMIGTTISSIADEVGVEYDVLMNTISNGLAKAGSKE